MSFFRVSVASLLVVISALVLPGEAFSQQTANEKTTERRIVPVEDADYFGHDYQTLKDLTLDACEAACLDDTSCKAFTYNSSAQWCFLKNGVGQLNTFAGAVAGKVVDVAARTETLPAPDLSFVGDWQIEQANRYRSGVEGQQPRDKNAEVHIAAGHAAMNQGDPVEAAYNFKLAAALRPDDGEVWLNVARAVQAIAPQDDSERYRLRDEAVFASIDAVRRSKSTDIRALAYAVLARALADKQLYRPALESYKASLALVDARPVRDAFTALHNQHGFRVVDYTVDADAASPRICVQFSEELEAGRFDFSPYVTLDGATPPAVTASGEQLCVDGVTHGERYRVTIRAGIPSIVDETLDQASEFEIYVRDRSPSVRFSGSSFVLPRVGSKGIPATTINASAVEIVLYRIGDRGLARAVGDGPFLRQLDDWDARQIAEETGEKLWTGTLEVAAGGGNALNKEITTIFPVDEALAERKPGVYVMTAKTTDSEQDYWEPLATQWFIVSDIGVSTLMGDDGLHVFARSLESAEPLAGVEIQLIARNNELLGEALTDANGNASFGAGLTRGTGGLAPGVLTAGGGKDLDFTFVDLTRSGFDLTDRGVAGRPAPGPLDVFMYTERGVYRPGETVYLTALVRNDNADAVSGPPLTVVVTRPDGVEDRQLVNRQDDQGGHVFNLPMIGAAMRGTWTVAAYVDPKGDQLAEIDFLVEDFVPDRIEFDLSSEAKSLPVFQPIEASVDGRFLYGAPAADLRLEGDIVVSPTSDLPDWPDYRFGLADEEVTAVRETLADLPRTDADGKASFEVAAPALPETTRPLTASIDIRIREGGGRAVERSISLPVAQTGPMIGIRPLFSDDTVPERTSAGFDVIVVGPDGSRNAASGLRWELVRIERNFQWYRTDGRWRYESVSYTSRIADGTVNVAADQPVRLSADVDWGRYRLEVATTDPDGPVTSYEFTGGWYVETSDADSPDTLELSLDKPGYKIGETAKVTIASRFAGKAIVNVIGENLIETRDIEVAETGTTVDLTVDENWSPGAYVTVTVIRPMGADASRMPARAVGLSWIDVDTADRTLQVALDLPDVARPRETLTVPATVDGLSPGEQAYLTVAAVDVGILNLTHYEPPEPEDWYYGQRRLAMAMRDIYGALINGLTGETGRLRSGGGAPSAGMEGSPPAQKPVSLFSGIVTADADGKASVSFDVPEFNGTLRVMAVAWTADSVGHGTGDVIVRDPVVMISSLPRFLAPGDSSRLRLEIDNADGPAGNWRLETQSNGAVTAGSPEPASMFNLAENARTTVSIPLTAAKIGQDRITLRLIHEGGMEITQSLNIGVRGAEPPLSERRVVSLQPGTSLTLDGALAADRIPGSGFVNLSVTRAGALDVPSIIAALDRYPYGCAEQLTSRGMPLLYLSSIAHQLGLGTEPELRARVDKAIAGVLAKQSASGGFGLWGPGDGDLWLAAYVTEFLTRAREAGHTVPDLAFGQALDNLSNTLAYTDDAVNQGSQIAYALYVLARNKRAAISDLRYYVDTQLDDFQSSLAKAQLGAALAFHGENQRARRAFSAALYGLQADTDSNGYRGDYGSRLRDGAATLTLVAESGTGSEPIAALIKIVDQERAGRRYTSTQEDGWMLMAANALISEGGNLELEEDGVAVDGNLMRRYTAERLDGQPVTVTNRSDRAVDAVITVSGIPAEPRGAEANGFEIARTYYDLDGNSVAVDEIGQNTRLVVVVEVTEGSDWPSKVLVVDLLPAGLEIDNPSLIGSADLSAFSWLPEDVNPAHVEFRDDRFVAAFEREGNEGLLTLAYVVRAVSPGSYVHPPASVEDMYRPYLNARGDTGKMKILGPRP